MWTPFDQTAYFCLFCHILTVHGTLQFEMLEDVKSRPIKRFGSPERRSRHLYQGFSNLSLHQTQLKGFLQYRLLGPLHKPGFCRSELEPENVHFCLVSRRWFCRLSGIILWEPLIWVIGIDVLTKEKAYRDQKRGLGILLMVPLQAPEVTEPGRRRGKRKRDKSETTQKEESFEEDWRL